MKERKKHQVIVGVEVTLLCMIIGVIGTNAASITPPSNQVSYNKNSQTTVQSAVNDLYTKLSYGDAASNEIVSGKTALVGGKQVVGTYTCPSVASQTPGDATPEDITEGKIAWVNGNKIVGTRTTLANKVKLGDYISYTPSRSSYEVPGAGDLSGAFGKIYPSNLKLWRVIRRTGDGVIELVSNGLGDRLAIRGIQGYLDYIKILNDAAKGYETDGYTIGSRHMGWDGKALEHLESIQVTCSDFTNHCLIGNPDEGYETDVSLVRSINSLDQGSDYFLASRSSGGEQAYFKLIRDGEVKGSGYELCDSSSSLHHNGKPIKPGACLDGSGTTSADYHSPRIRPIVYLNPDLKITGGDGTESSPYTLGT